MSKIEKTGARGPNVDAAERRALTDDILTISRKQMEKEFERRIKEAEDAYDKAYDAAVACATETGYVKLVGAQAENARIMLQDDVEFSFKLIASKSPSHDIDIYISTACDEEILPNNRWKTEAALSRIAECYTEMDGCYDWDLTIGMTVYVATTNRTDENGNARFERDDDGDLYNQDIDEVELSRMEQDVTCTQAIMLAREKLVPLALAWEKAGQHVLNCKSDLSSLDEKLEELKLQAAAERVADAGGAELFRNILESANQIMAGRELDGIAASGVLAIEQDDE